MSWFDVCWDTTELAMCILFGCGITWLASTLFKSRFRFCTLVFLAAACGGRFFLQKLAETVNISPVTRITFLTAFIFLCLCGCFSGSMYLRVYIAIAYMALSELAFFASSATVATVQPYLADFFGTLIQSGISADEATQSIYTAILIVNVLQTVFQGGVLFVLVWLLTRSFPQKGSEPLSRAEFLTVLLPTLCSLLLVVLVRLLGSVTRGDPPVTILDMHPDLYILLSAILATLGALILGSVRTMTSLRTLNLEHTRLISAEMQLAALRNQIPLTEQRHAATRRIRHDLQNTITVVKALAVSDREALKSYLEDLVSDVQSTLPTCKTGSIVADALFSANMHKIRSELPDCTLDIDNFSFDPAWGISEYDMGIILGNALEMAIRDAETLHDKDPTATLCIKAASFTNGRFVELRFQNTCCRDVRLHTDCEASLASIHAIAEKYSGNVNFKEVNGTFLLAILLECPQSLVSQF